MTKITTDFVGSETIAVTKQRLTDILAYWGASTAAYTTWGQARTALNALLTSTTAGTIGSTELAGSFLPKVNFLNDPDDMIADALFGAGEQGVWLDPSDVANVDWRRNILLRTEQFDNSIWGKDNSGAVDPVVTANYGVAPDGTSTADRLQLDKTGGFFTRLQQSSGLSGLPAGVYTFSVWMKNNVAGTANVGLRIYTTAVNCAVTTTWQRFSVSLPAADTNAAAQIMLFDSIVGNDETADILVWGAQVELGTVATEYQRITDLNTEVIERFPNATMYQDIRGQTPVYAPGQPVGLRLDKSKGLVPGPELVVSPVFAAQNANSTVAEAGGIVTTTCTANGTYGLRIPALAAVVGTSYQVYFEIVTNTASKNMFFYIGGPTFGAGTTTGNKFAILPDTTSTLVWTLYISDGVAGESFSVRVSSISVKELPGNHATQSTAGSRPMYGIEPKGGRRNLLTFSEQFDNAVWGKTGVIVTANTITAPDGTLTADTLANDGTSSGVCSQVALISTGLTYTFSVWLRRRTGSGTVFLVDVNGTNIDVTGLLTSEFQRITATATSTSTSGRAYIRLLTSGDAVDAWGAQLELGSTATNYQRVTTDFDVTEAGVNTCHYCQYDGSDDGMITNSIDFTATDKMSVFAGVRKNSDAATGMLLELSPTTETNNGSFMVTAPGFSGSQSYAFRSKGTIVADALPGVVAAAPTTNVATGLGDISGDLATLRVNGTQVAQAIGNQGTGNFGNYPLYLGRRGGSTLPFSGRDYGILITGKLANATAIATTEMYLANKTPGVTL